MPTRANGEATATCAGKYRLRREAAYATGLAEFTELAKDPLFRDFVCLYIGEGYKRDRNTVSIANSDPGVIEIRVQRKSNSGGLAGRTWRSVHGVLAVTSCDTMLRARLQAWIDCVRSSWV